MTADAWARQEGVEVSNSIITKRLRRGMSPRDAICGEKVTHKSKKKKAKAKHLHQTQQSLNNVAFLSLYYDELLS